MRRFTRVIVPLVVMVAVVGLVTTVMDSGNPKTTPYLSALSQAFVTPALARGGCAFKDCVGGSRHNLVCGKVTTPTVCTSSKGICAAGGCA